MAATHSHVGMNSNRTRPTEDIFNPQDSQIREVGLSNRIETSGSE